MHPHEEVAMLCVKNRAGDNFDPQTALLALFLSTWGYSHYHIHSILLIWSSDKRSFRFYGQFLAPNYGPKHNLNIRFLGNMVISAIFATRPGPYIRNQVY